MFSKIIITPNYFPTAWCDRVNNFMLKNVEPDPRFGTAGVRKCIVRHLSPGLAAYDGVFKSMMDFVKVNAKKLQVDIDGKIDGSVQHITYNVGHQVGWHNDTMSVPHALSNPNYNDLKTNRKLSMTVMLSDPSDFQGGEFVFENGIAMPHKMEGKGTCALFTSHSQHKVNPITGGVRHILFIFCTGPEWR